MRSKGYLATFFGTSPNTFRTTSGSSALRSMASSILSRNFASSALPSHVLDITTVFHDSAGQPFRAIPDHLKPGEPPGPNACKSNNEAFQAAFDSTQYSEIYIPPGRYVFSKSITLSMSKIIKGSTNLQPVMLPSIGEPVDCSDTILEFCNSNKNSVFFDIHGSANINTPISISQTLNDRVTNKVTFRFAHGLKLTDRLILTNPNDYSYGTRKYYYQGEFLTLSNIPDQKSIEFTPRGKYEYFSIPSFKSFEIFKVNPIEVTLENFTIVDAKTQTEVNLKSLTAIRLSYCVNSKVNNIFVIDASYNSGLFVSNCFNVNINKGKYIIAIPDSTRIKKPTKFPGYSTIFPNQDAYSIGIGYSQLINVNDVVEARSFGHAIATGSGAIGSIGIVNRDIKITGCTFIAKSAPLQSYDNKGVLIETVIDKIGLANFHGNTEDSGFHDNILKGSGFNIGGYNNNFVHNIITTNNYKETRSFPSDYRHCDSAFYFNEARGGKFTVKDNHVTISKFYQVAGNPPISVENYRHGEFVDFGSDAFNIDNSTLSWPGVVYDNGKLIIQNNIVNIECVGENQDHVNEYFTGLITIAGLQINSKLSFDSCLQYPSRLPTNIDVEISDNHFNILGNPKNSKCLITVSPKKAGHNPSADPPKYDFWPRIRNISIKGNAFYGLFRVHVNKSELFENTKTETLTIEGNTFKSKSPNNPENSIIEVDSSKVVNVSMSKNNFTDY
ncbi:MAG: hypothetical protein K2X50_06295 [Gammaproteobacteria bacterium]|nr:hypothetical protein [Gammaproteobacteria bacterium]